MSFLLSDNVIKFDRNKVILNSEDI